MLQHRYYLPLAITVAGIIIIFFLDPIPQNQNYHRFADSNVFLSIANFWNVTSNLPLIIAGLFGFIATLKNKTSGAASIFPQGYVIFFIAVALSGAGSVYYHLKPENQTLLWDRLPIAITFMAFFSIILAEFVSVQFAKKVFYPLIILGISSVLYWIISENMGAGDLRPYILVQFLPLILIPFILLTFKSQSTIDRHIWLILLLYFLAKIFELLDYQIYSVLKIISGHSLKHIAASIAAIILILAIQKKGFKKV